jgi:hypothetical protein
VEEIEVIELEVVDGEDNGIKLFIGMTVNVEELDRAVVDREIVDREMVEGEVVDEEVVDRVVVDREKSD